MSEARTARQFWVRAPGQGEIRQEPLGPARDGQVLVRTLYSAISRGTESLVFRGQVPESEYETMRAPFQEGDFPGPVKYGYTSVGEVLEGPGSLQGRTVFCLHPHQDLYRVPAGAVTPLPPDLPAGRAVLAPAMETAVNVLWDASPGVGDRVVVVGAGVIGILVARLCAGIPGVDLTLVDVDPGREAVAAELGLPFATGLPPEVAAGSARGQPVADTSPTPAPRAPGGDRARGADLVIHASGNPEGLATALRAAGVEGTIVEVSWYGNRAVELPLGEGFHSRRLTIRSSQVGRVPPGRRPRWTRGRRMRLALELLRDPSLDALITGESDFEELPEVLDELSREPGDTLCHRIRYSGPAHG